MEPPQQPAEGQDDRRRLSSSDHLVLLLGTLLFVDSFLPWYGGSTPVIPLRFSLNAWDLGGGGCSSGCWGWRPPCWPRTARSTGGVSMVERAFDGLVAGAIASVPSGVPSTLHAFWTGRDLLDTVRAAGSLLAPAGASGGRLVVSGVAAHMAISLGWGAVLGMVLPRKAAWGAAAGLAIAGLDLGIVGRRLPKIRALPPLPQIADHLAYGAIVGAVLSRRS